jgi:NitT/TauT family transport system substrate-binding protein
MNRFIAIAVAATIGIATFAASAVAEPVKIRIGWAAAPVHITPVLFANTEILKNYGKSYVVDAIRFKGSPPQITALASGDVNIAALSGSALTAAVNNAKLDLRVIGDLLGDGRPDHYSLAFMVANDSGINEISDLKGKKVAVNSIGSAGDSAMRVMLRKNSLADNDFTTVEVGLRNHVKLLEAGQVDMAMVLPNFLGRMQSSGKFKTLFTMADAVGETQALVLVARADYIQENRAALVDFMEDWITGVRWFLDPANADAAHAVVAKVTKREPDAFRYAFTKNDFQRDLNGTPSLKNLQKAIDIGVDAGVIKNRLVVDPKYADLSIVEDALKRTGRQ